MKGLKLSGGFYDPSFQAAAITARITRDHVHLISAVIISQAFAFLFS